MRRGNLLKNMKSARDAEFDKKFDELYDKLYRKYMDNGLLRYARVVAARYPPESLRFYLVKSLLYAVALGIWLAAVIFGCLLYLGALLGVFLAVFLFLFNIAAPIASSLSRLALSSYEIQVIDRIREVGLGNAYLYFAAAVLILCLLFIGLSLGKRREQMSERGDRRAFDIIYKDLSFDYSVNLNIITFVYALIRGFCKGLNFGSLGVGVIQAIAFPSSPWLGWFALSLLSYFIVLFARLWCEGYANSIRLSQSENLFYKSNTPKL